MSGNMAHLACMQRSEKSIHFSPTTRDEKGYLEDVRVDQKNNIKTALEENLN
jgi:hypothetical protein